MRAGVIDAVRKAVGEIIGVYDAPDWLIGDLLGDLGSWDYVDEVLARRLVELNSPKLFEAFKRNLQQFRPGRSSIRKAAPYLVAELAENAGFKPSFIRLFGVVLPAVYRGGGLYTPLVPVVEARKPVLNLLTTISKYPGASVVLSSVDKVPGLRLEIRRLHKAPFYYAIADGLADAVERAGALRAPRDEAGERLYSFWSEHRRRGFLVVPGREVAGYVVDMLAVGLGRYGAVVKASRRKINRLSKYLDAVYEL